AVPATVGAFSLVQALALALVPRWRRGGVVVAAVVALVAPIVATLKADPDERTVALLAVESRGGRGLVGVARGFFDPDGAGYSTGPGGGDCNATARTIPPGAVDTPDDGIDQNCIGGDAHAPPPPPAAPAAAPAAPPPPSALTWNGNILIVAVDTLRADRLGI